MKEDDTKIIEVTDEFRFYYLLKPGNFDSLPPNEQYYKIQLFLKLLSNVPNNHTILIRIVRKSLGIPIYKDSEQETTDILVPRIYMASGFDMSRILRRFEFDFDHILAPHFFSLVTEKTRHLKLQSTNSKEIIVGKCFTMYDLRKIQPDGWIFDIFEHCDMITVSLKPLDEKSAKKYVNSMEGVFAENALRKQVLRQKHKMVSTISTLLATSKTQLFECTVNVLITAKNMKSLKEKVSEFKSEQRNFEGWFDSIGGIQASMLYKNTGVPIFFNRGSLGIFYPFVSADVLELPYGLFLGINDITGMPIFFDWLRRINKNMCITGKTGSGKSTLAKKIIAELEVKFPTAEKYILNPSGEYANIAHYLNLKPIELTSTSSIGLDPFKTMSSTDAANMLISVSEPSNVVAKEFMAKSEVKSLEEFYKSLSDVAKGYVQDLVNGPLAEYFKGELEFDTKTIFSMRGLDPKDRHTWMMLIIILRKLWNRIGTLKRQGEKDSIKFIVIDEAWMLFALSRMRPYIENMLRSGRKYNIWLILITQEPDDLIQKDTTDPKPNFIAHIETKIFGIMEKSSIDLVSDKLNLSRSEVDMLGGSTQGRLLLLTSKYRVPVNVTLSKQEKEVFFTTSKVEELL
ncbi:MAG: ATP-binding protein [Candidatus Nitrosoabyssus spongiisocia]|nr:MAG: ATP-binding protein [Nitrosopumilaceae archaeon AB1(1)]